MKEREKQLGSCAQDGLLSAPAMGRSQKKKKNLGPATHIQNPIREISSLWLEYRK